MKSLNKKGFTLVELLAVIVVLALLMVVAASSIGNALTNSKKNTLKTEAQKFVTTAYQEAQSQYMLTSSLPTSGDWNKYGTVYIYEKDDGDYNGIVAFNSMGKVTAYCVNYNLNESGNAAEMVIGETYASAVEGAPSVSKATDVTQNKYCTVNTTNGTLKYDNANAS